MNQNKLQADPYQEWLGAYFDGELSGERRAWVEEHLAACATCQSELESLRLLSGLLHADDEQVPTGSQKFAGEVARRLPQSSQNRWQRFFNAALRYAPLGLFAAWAFSEVILWVSGGLLFGLSWLPGGSSLLPVGSESGLAGLLTSALNAGGLADVTEALNALSFTPWFSPFGVINFVIIAVMAVLFSAWLAGLWAMHRQQKPSLADR